MRIKLVLSLVFLFSVFSFADVSSAKAQEIPEDRKASFAFDIDATRLMKSKYIQAVGVDAVERFFDLQMLLPSDVSISEVTRFYGFVELSEPFSSFMNFGPGNEEVPINFIVRVEFKTDKVVGLMREEIESNSTTEEVDGKTFYGPPENAGNDSANLRVSLEGNLLAMGTKEYLCNDEEKFMTAKLAELWESVPKENGVRAAIDLVDAREFVDGFLKLLVDEGMGPDQMMKTALTSVIDVVSEIDSATVFADLDNETVLSLSMNSKSEDSREKIKGVTDGLFFLVALPIKSLIQLAGFDKDEDQGMLTKLADQLKAKEVGDSVKVEIVKPENFDQVASDVYLPMLKEYARKSAIRQSLQTASSGAIQYYYRNDYFPFNRPEEAEWSEDLSWRVRILDGIYQENTRDLVALVDVSKPWDDESNQAVIDRMPRCFGSDGNQSNLVWVKSKIETMEEVTDGTHQTIMLIRLPESTDQPWTQPESISMLKVIRLVSKLEDGEVIYAATYGGQILEMDNTWTHNQVKAYLTPAAGD